jgi:transcription antitermination protein NusB
MPSNSESAPQTQADHLSRRDARIFIFHYLYAMEAFEYSVSLESIVDNFNKGFEWTIKLDDEMVKEAAHIIKERETIDAEYLPLLENWRLERLGVCTKLILRLGIWELKYTDTDASIIINEAIEIAKCFAEQDAYKFINGILDQWVDAHKKIAE